VSKIKNTKQNKTMDFNKLIKAELISELKKSNKNTPKNKSKDSNNQKSISIIDFIFYMKNWILTFTIISLLIKFFKKYKTIKSVLYLINYAILAVFGVSLIDAFGFGIVIRLFAELKYIFGSIIHYLTHNSFYDYLSSTFNANEEKTQRESIRKMYEQKEDNSWNDQIEKRKRELENEKWHKKWEKIAEEKRKDQYYEDNKKAIFFILATLSLLGAAWYFSDSIAPAASPIINIFNTLRNYIKGDNNNYDDPDDKWL
jgi:hypothetical protein